MFLINESKVPNQRTNLIVHSVMQEEIMARVEFRRACARFNRIVLCLLIVRVGAIM